MTGRPPGGRFQMTRPGSSASRVWYQARRSSSRRACRSKDRRRRVGSASRCCRRVSSGGIVRVRTGPTGRLRSGSDTSCGAPSAGRYRTPQDRSHARAPALVPSGVSSPTPSTPSGQDRVRAVGFEPGRGVLGHERRQVTPAPCCLAGSAGTCDYDDHTHHLPLTAATRASSRCSSSRIVVFPVTQRT